jgi:hypothetical protein
MREQENLERFMIARATASWFETRGVAALLTTRVREFLILRRRTCAVSKDEATTVEMP